MALQPHMQKDIPSEEIKTGEEDDDDNGDNLLKDSNDSKCVGYCSSVFIRSAAQSRIATVRP